MIEPTRQERAEWAKEALTVFMRRTYPGNAADQMNPCDMKTATIDLIADLLHFAARHGIDTQCNERIRNRASTGGNTVCHVERD